MEDNNLNKRVIENVRNRVVVSNLEGEETMKLNKRKQVLSMAAVMVIMFAGGFMIVNAATNGELSNKVKEAISVVVEKKGGKKEEVKPTEYVDANGHTIEKYEVKDGEAEHSLEIDKTNLDGENIKANITMKDNETSITLEGQGK